MIPRFAPSITLKDLLSALRFRTESISLFEKLFAEKFKNTYGVMFPYGRSGLYSLLKIWGLNNKEVICPAYTCVVVPHAIVLSGNIPVFVDSEENGFNMSITEIEKAITSRTAAVIVTHLYGHPVNVFEVANIIRLAERKHRQKIFVVQDCAHSYGCTFNGSAVTEHGDASIFGMNISKIINSIFGGMVITNNKETYYRLLHHRAHNYLHPSCFKTLRRLSYLIGSSIAFNEKIYGLVHYLQQSGFLDRFTKYYDEGKIELPPDWNDLPLEIEARVGLSQLEQYDRFIEERRKYARFYHENLADSKVLKLPPFSPESTYSHIVALVDNREKFCEYCYSEGVEPGRVIEYSIPHMKAYRERLVRDPSIFPRALYYSKHTINLPVSNTFNLKNASKVVKVIKNFEQYEHSEKKYYNSCR